MDGTPKIQRKAPLSLSTRLNKKRHSASPQQNRMKSAREPAAINSNELIFKTTSPQRSPSVVSICSDGGIECTPPHKMSRNLDENLDFSPKLFDSSFSPTCLLSQTLAIDSPEVGWKWSRHSGRRGDPSCGIETTAIRTPDSAYAADSSFASAGSNSTETVGNNQIKGNYYKQRNASCARREDQRKIMEQELRRVEHTRAEELLKQRCAKLQEQFQSVGKQKLTTNSLPKENIKNNVNIISESSSSVEIKSQYTNQLANTEKHLQATENTGTTDLLNDFLDDSDMDCFLLQATQEIESKISGKTQPVLKNCASNTLKPSTYSETSSIPHISSAPAAFTTPPSNKSINPPANVPSKNANNKDKRSSFYMKFLEDDCPDEWFVSLDDAILRATENKKPRNSLQRYKSMPTETAGTSKVLLNKKDNNGNCVLSTNTIPEETETSSTFSKIKRHSSTHTLSPAGSHWIFESTDELSSISEMLAAYRHAERLGKNN